MPKRIPRNAFVATGFMVSQPVGAAASATVTINNSPESGIMPTSSKTANYSVLSTDSGTSFDNGGASGLVIFTLPPPTPGLNYRFTVIAGQTVEVAASSASAVAIGPDNSATDGSVSSDIPFSSIFVYAPSGATDQWIAIEQVGAWIVD